MDLALETIRVLRRFKNVVLEGPPGVGKSHVVRAIAEQWTSQTGRTLSGDGSGRYAITLHPNSSYDDFVEGLRYSDAAQAFVRRDGFLLNVIADAKASPDADFLVLIDELNRANVPRVLGDLLLTMEASKRSRWDGTAWIGGVEVTLPYSGVTFSVPSNVYLLATMNTTDRSVAPLDSALRRRFGFVRVSPLGGAELSAQISAVDGDEAAAALARSVSELTNLNAALELCLGPDATIGHSHLFGVFPTEGALAASADPLALLRDALARTGSQSCFWLEVGGMWGYSQNQLDIPGEGASRPGLLDLFFPTTSGGVTRTSISPREPCHLDLTIEGQRFVGSTIEVNEGGNNTRLKYKGRNSADQSILIALDRKPLHQSVHVWIRLPDQSFELVLLDRSVAVISALQNASSGKSGWNASTGGTNGRSYGRVDVEKLHHLDIHEATSTPQGDAEWMVWRYGILPQLLETASQAGASELLDRGLRPGWLMAAGLSHTADRWEVFDHFLGELQLRLEMQGHGLSRAVSIADSPRPQGLTASTDEDEADGADDASLERDE